MSAIAPDELSRFWWAGGFVPARDGGLLIVFDVLAEFAAHAHNPGVAAVARRFGGALDVAVLGRPGVGRAAVAAALAGSGVTMATDGAAADLRVLVV
ncbi:MAG TPA: hypothetical protein VMS92_04580, partial [Mycobacterium sp.]|nr:hypothetical protein [Mycobacterium sp.]